MKSQDKPLVLRGKVEITPKIAARPNARVSSETFSDAGIGVGKS